MNKSERKIVAWMLGNDTGLSSLAIAAAALGVVNENPNYPRDSADFGRCYRLIKSVPYARRGLARLATDGGPVWAALVVRWKDIEKSYSTKGRGTYELLWSILKLAEDELYSRRTALSRATEAEG